jgi:hypothetical protein
MEPSEGSLPLADVQGVEADRARVDDHVVRAGDRVVPLAEPEDVGPAESGVFVSTNDDPPGSQPVTPLEDHIQSDADDELAESVHTSEGSAPRAGGLSGRSKPRSSP